MKMKLKNYIKIKTIKIKEGIGKLLLKRLLQREFCKLLPLTIKEDISAYYTLEITKGWKSVWAIT